MLIHIFEAPHRRGGVKKEKKKNWKESCVKPLIIFFSSLFFCGFPKGGKGGKGKRRKREEGRGKVERIGRRRKEREVKIWNHSPSTPALGAGARAKRDWVEKGNKTKWVVGWLQGTCSLLELKRDDLRSGCRMVAAKVSICSPLEPRRLESNSGCGVVAIDVFPSWTQKKVDHRRCGGVAEISLLKIPFSS